jgi:hypothetical protein
MHQGQIPAPHQNHMQQPQYHQQPAQSNPHHSPTNGPISATAAQPPSAASIDDLISNASKQADAKAATPQPVPTPPPAKIEPPATVPTPVPSATATKEEPGDEKASKKEKDKSKATRLVYSDNETSPEEKMAMLSRYAFHHDKRTVAV